MQERGFLNKLYVFEICHEYLGRTQTLHNYEL